MRLRTLIGRVYWCELWPQRGARTGTTSFNPRDWGRLTALTLTLWNAPVLGPPKCIEINHCCRQSMLFPSQSQFFADLAFCWVSFCCQGTYCWVRLSGFLLIQFLVSQFFAYNVRYCWVIFCWQLKTGFRLCIFTCLCVGVCIIKEWNILQSFIVLCLRTILYVTHQFMYGYIVKSSIASKIAQNATHIDTFTSEYTIACAIMSTETTDNTL